MSSRSTFLLARTAVRHYSTPVKEVVNPKVAKLKEIQKKFSVDNGIPVYLKGGILDKLLYQATCVVTFTALGMTFHTWWQLSQK